MPKIKCPNCYLGSVDCPVCKGSGKLPGNLFNIFKEPNCDHCNGTGHKECNKCLGNGFIYQEEEKVQIEDEYSDNDDILEEFNDIYPEERPKFFSDEFYRIRKENDLKLKKSAESLERYLKLSRKQIAAFCGRCGAVPGITEAGTCPSGYNSHSFIVLEHVEIAYCERCAAVPGFTEAGLCPSGYNSHSFKIVNKSTAIFCERCAAVPGITKAGTCPSGYNSHSFIYRSTV